MTENKTGIYKTTLELTGTEPIFRLIQKPGSIQELYLPPSDNILAMSYNVCWGCVTQNTGDATAQSLPQTCKDRTTTGTENICLLNVAKVFDEVEKEAGQELDLVGTQESARWEDIINHSIALKRMNYVHHTTTDNRNNSIEFLSLYNGEKFILDALKYGNLDNTNNERRPYHILFLTHIRLSL